MDRYACKLELTDSVTKRLNLGRIYSSMGLFALSARDSAKLLTWEMKMVLCRVHSKLKRFSFKNGEKSILTTSLPIKVLLRAEYLLTQRLSVSCRLAHQSTSNRQSSVRDLPTQSLSRSLAITTLSILKTRSTIPMMISMQAFSISWKSSWYRPIWALPPSCTASLQKVSMCSPIPRTSNFNRP